MVEKVNPSHPDKIADRIANDLHISQTSVSKYERKESLPDLEMAVKIADYFGVSLDDFIRNYINS